MRDFLRFVGTRLLVFGRWTLIVVGGAAIAMALLWGRARDDGRFDAEIGNVLSLALAAGLITTAALELAKRLTPLRGWFQRREIRRYLSEDSRQTESHVARQLDRALGDAIFFRGESEWREDYYPPRAAFWAFRSHDLRYIYALPMEQLTAQIGGAVELALGSTDTASQYEALLTALAGEPATQLTKQGDGEDSGQAVLRNRVSHHVQRGLEALQIVVGHRWRWFVRGSAVVIATVVALLISAQADLGLYGSWPELVIIAVLGGLLSWFSRDVMAVVERWRR